MTYEDASWLVDLSTAPYLPTRHTALQSQVARSVLNYDLELAGKKSFQLMIENLRNLAAQ